MNNRFTNELYDVVAHEDMGFEALHVLGPDEIVMAMEEASEAGMRNDECGMPNEAALSAMEERCRCLVSVMRMITWRATSAGELRDNVAILFGEKIGWREVPVMELWEGRADYAMLRGRLARLMGEKRLDWEPVAGELVLRWLARDWSVREVSKRVLLLLYAFFPDQRWRPQMARSLHAIGETLGLTATNKRSAVSAAMQSQVLPLMRGLGGGAAVKLWFMKNPGCRAALSVAMKGKRNRKKKEVSVQRSDVRGLISEALTADSLISEEDGNL